MGRTEEDDLPVEDAYKRLLRDEISHIGRDRIAELAEIDPSTVHRNVNQGRLTFTTARKLHNAIAEAHRQDKSSPERPVPPPFVAVVSQSHYELCDLSRRLHDIDYDAFAEVLELALEKLHDAALKRANEQITHPIRNDANED